MESANLPNYHSTICTDSTRNVDAMLYRFAQDRAKVVESLVTNPVRFAISLWDPQQSPLSIDRKCMCQLGERYHSVLGPQNAEEELGVVGDHDDRFLRGLFRCAQCRNIGRLTDLQKKVVDRPFNIECGQLAGTQLVVHRRSLSPALELELTDAPRSLAISLLARHQDVRSCQPSVSPSEDLEWLQVDPFTNEILVTWLLDNQMTEQGFHHLVRMHTAFVCGDDGFVVYQRPSLGHVHGLQAVPEVLDPVDHNRPTAKARTHIPIQPMVVLGVIKQLVAILRYVSRFDFTHGDPSGRALFFDSHPCSYRYDDVHVMCPITLKLGDLAMSSLTIQSSQGPLRIFPYADDRRTITRFPFVPMIETIGHVPLATSLDEFGNTPLPEVALPGCAAKTRQPGRYLTYRLSAETAAIMVSARHLGIPLFGSSLDLYCFIVALMLEPAFMSSVQNDPTLCDLWASLWLPEELSIVNERISALSSSLRGSGETDNLASFPVILGLLQGLRLRCDVTEMLWNKIKEV